MRATYRWLAASATVLALGLTACSAGGDDAQSGSAAAPVADPAGADADGKAADGEAFAGGGAQGADTRAKAPQLAPDQRSIIYTGSITLRVDDVDEQAARAIGIVAGVGGHIGSDKRHSGDTETATLELRVPAAQFQTVVDRLAAELGDEEDRSVDTQDVTEEMLDMGARITSQQARVESGRRLLAQAKDLKDLVMLEGELATREADLASLLAKQKRLTDLTAMSTITVVLLDPAARSAGPADDPGFLGGLAAGWDALVASLRVLLTILGALLPWLIALGLPALAILWLIRRNRRPAVTPAAPAEPAPAE